jgi:hypothetical protein
MNRRRVEPRSAVLVVLFALCGVVGAPALAIEPNVDCRQPSVFPEAAVNLVILPYDYAGERDELSEGARRLAMLIQLDMIFSIAKYGSVGVVHTVRRPAADKCLPATVLAQLTGRQAGARRTLKTGGGLVLMWGQVYEEGNDLYIQTYARFLRHERTEALEVVLRNHRFTVRPPSQAFAFPARHMTREDLTEIERAFMERVMVRENPNDQAKGAPPVMDLSTSDQAYWVSEIQGDWIRITPQRPGAGGWVRAGGSASSWPLRSKMPELNFIDALAGYLAMRVAAGAGDPMREQTLSWIEDAVARYAKADRDAADPLPVAVGRAMTGMLRMQRIKPGDAKVHTVRQAWTEAALLIPYSPAARNLDVMGRMCALIWAPNASPAEVAPAQGSVFRFAANNLAGALALAPDEPDTAKNLAQLYLLLLAPDAPTELAAVKPFTREELTARLAALRTAVPTAMPESSPAPH